MNWRRFDELAAQYRQETDLKRLDAILFTLRRECADLDHAYNDRGICEWCGEIHWSIPKHRHGLYRAEVDSILASIGKSTNGVFEAS